MSNLNVIGIQTQLYWEDIDQNLKHFDQLVDQSITSVDQNIDLIIFPEMFSTGFSMKPQNLAEPIDGKVVQWMIRKAKETNAVLTGSLIIEEDGKYYNRLFWIEPNGHIETYNKRHLFRLANEQDVYTGGEERKIVEYKGWRILLNICYDLRFPVWSRNQNDYDLMIYVANWPERRNTAWKSLLQARAIENQAYCIGINRIGDDGNGIYHSGDSSIIEYDGAIKLQVADKERLLFHTLSKENLDTFRAQFPFHMDADQFSIT